MTSHGASLPPTQLADRPVADPSVAGGARIYPPASFLQLRVIRSPLSTLERNRVLSEYNRLTGNRVAIQEFRRWTEQSPAGPAVHALLEANDGRILAHCCLLPFPLQSPGGSLTVAKEHYFFISEHYRSQPVRDFESCKKPAVALLLEQLHQRAAEVGWGPILACVPPQLEPIHEFLGCRPVDFEVRDCFFLLHPLRAWQTTHHLPIPTRISLSAASLGSQTYAAFLNAFPAHRGLVRYSRIGEDGSRSDTPSDFLTFSDDPAFLCWRYPQSFHSRLVVNGGSEGCIIVTKGSPFTYVRVSQFQAPSSRAIPALIEKLIREARGSGALGVRWSVYGHGPEQDHLVAELRKRIFFCIRRTRRVLLSGPNSETFSAKNWNLADSLFTFHL